jgi:hypothetical protein
MLQEAVDVDDVQDHAVRHSKITTKKKRTSIEYNFKI